MHTACTPQVRQLHGKLRSPLHGLPASRSQSVNCPAFGRVFESCMEGAPKPHWQHKEANTCGDTHWGACSGGCAGAPEGVAAAAMAAAHSEEGGGSTMGGPALVAPGEAEAGEVCSTRQGQLRASGAAPAGEGFTGDPGVGHLSVGKRRSAPAGGARGMRADGGRVDGQDLQPARRGLVDQGVQVGKAHSADADACWASECDTARLEVLPVRQHVAALEEALAAAWRQQQQAGTPPKQLAKRSASPLMPLQQPQAPETLESALAGLQQAVRSVQRHIMAAKGGVLGGSLAPQQAQALVCVVGQLEALLAEDGREEGRDVGPEYGCTQVGVVCVDMWA